MIRFACPRCESEHEVDDAFAGYTAKCSHCGLEVEVPGGAPAAVAAPERAAEQAPPSRPGPKGAKSGRNSRPNEARSRPLKDDEPEAPAPLAGRFASLKARLKGVSRRVWVGVGVAALLLVVLAVVFSSKKKPPPPPPPPPARVESPPPPPSPPPPAPTGPPVVLLPRAPLPPEARSVAQLSADFVADPFAANRRYRHRAVEVRGIFASDPDWGPAVAGAPGSLPVLCEFIDAQALRAAGGGAAAPPPQPPLEPGQPVSVRGLYTEDCRLVNCEVAATDGPGDAEFKGREVEVEGVVRVALPPAGIGDYPTLSLEGPTDAAVSVAWLFPLSDEPQLAALKPGQRVAVRGTCGGRWQRVVRVDNCRVLSPGRPPDAAARTTTDRLCRAFESDLVVRERARPEGAPVAATPARLAREFQDDPAAARERYARAALDVSGTIVERRPDEYRVLLESPTNARLRVLASFAPSRYRELEDASRVVLRCVCSGSDGAFVRLDDAVFLDPEAAAPRLTADFFPLDPGREFTFLRTQPLEKKGKEIPVQRVVMRVMEDGEIRGGVLRTGHLTGTTVLPDQPLRIRWTSALLPERKARSPFVLHYRVGEQFVEIGHGDHPDPATGASPKDDKLVWEPILKLGIRAGQSWKAIDARGNETTYKLERFREDASGRTVADVTKIAVHPDDKKSRYESHIAYARGVGEVERTVYEKVPALAPKLTVESKLIDNASLLTGPDAPKADGPEKK